MQLRYTAVVISAAAALAMPAAINAVAADAHTAHSAALSGPRTIAPSAKIHTSRARSVVLSHVSSKPLRVQKHIPAPLGKDGKPVGSALPTGKSTGVKGGGFTAAAAPKQLILQGSFDGVRYSSSSCSCQPPDVNAAIGPNHIVEAVNLSLAVYTRAGSQLSNTPLSTFLNTTDSLSDPRVVYDPTWDRYTLVLTDITTPSLWLAYSKTSDPTGGWWIYKLNTGYSAGTILDYPMVGMDQDSMIYTTNNYDASESYTGSIVFAVAKARVYNGFGFGATLFPVQFGTAPAIVGGHPTQQSSPTFLLSPDDSSNTMRVYSFNNTSKAPALVDKGTIAYTWAAPTRQVNQPGTTQKLDPSDGRIPWAVSQLDGRIWFAHGVDSGGFPTINWGYVDSGTMTLNVGTAWATNSSDDFNPSIAAIKDNSGITRQVLTWAYTDTPNSVSTTPVYAIHAGVSAPHIGSNGNLGVVGNPTSVEFRFGDYSSVSPEYNSIGSCSEGSGALVAQQYFGTDGHWKTRLARVSISGC